MACILLCSSKRRRHVVLLRRKRRRQEGSLVEPNHFYSGYGRLLCRPRKLLAFPLPVLQVWWSLVLHSLLDLPPHYWYSCDLHGALSGLEIPAWRYWSVQRYSPKTLWYRNSVCPRFLLHCGLLQHHHRLVSDLSDDVLCRPSALVKHEHHKRRSNCQRLSRSLHYARVSSLFISLVFL